MKAKSFSAPRSINMIDAIRIDWKTAIKEAEDLCKKYDKGPDFKDTLKAYSILVEVQDFYKKDDVSGYLDFLEENRSLLKGSAVIKKENSHAY